MGHMRDELEEAGPSPVDLAEIKVFLSEPKDFFKFCFMLARPCSFMDYYTIYWLINISFYSFFYIIPFILCFCSLFLMALIYLSSLIFYCLICSSF